MATKFKVWIDSPTSSNVMGESAYQNDTQRVSGFVSGTAASSIRVNTALRSATLITSAIMQAIAPTSTFDHMASVDDIATLLQTYWERVPDSVQTKLNQKLDMKTTTGTYQRVYGIEKDGSQSLFDVNDEVGSGSVVKRGSNGYFFVKTPLEDGHPVNKQYADNTYAKSTDVTNTYATKEELNNYLTKSGAESTYATKSELSTNYLTKSVIEATYATNTNLTTNYLTKSSIESTYASKTYVDEAIGTALTESY